MYFLPPFIPPQQGVGKQERVKWKLSEMKEQPELSLEQLEEGKQGPNLVFQGVYVPHVLLSLGAASSLQQISAWQISREQPEAVQAISIKGSAVKDEISRASHAVYFLHDRTGGPLCAWD